MKKFNLLHKEIEILNNKNIQLEKDFNNINLQLENENIDDFERSRLVNAGNEIVLQLVNNDLKIKKLEKEITNWYDEILK